MKKTLFDERKPIVTVDDFLGTYQNPSRPEPQAAKRFLEEKGLLPLNYQAPLFPQINILVSSIFWSGSVYLGGNPEIRLSFTTPQNLESVEEGIRGLEAPLTSTTNQYRLGENAARYARLISKIPGMFVSAGNQSERDIKTRRDVTFPEYLEVFTDNYRAITGEMKRIARKTLADHFNIFLQTRLKTRGVKRFRCAHLFRSDSPENAQRYGEFMIKLANRLYPQMGLDNDSVKFVDSPNREGGRYYSTINFTEDNLAQAIRHYNLFRVELNREFHPLEKNSSYRGVNRKPTGLPQR